MKTVAVIGGGPAGLMAAEVLSQHGVQVNLYEAKSSIGRKFLVAGKGGMNLTHSEPFDSFVSRYGPQADRIRPILETFGPAEVCSWCREMGIETFVGSSGRVFPDDMKALPLLQRWTRKLVSSGVEIKTRHCWRGWNPDGHLQFDAPLGPLSVRADAVILTLGGASWPKLGSDGQWVPLLKDQQIEIADLQPSNCGFAVHWSDHFRERYAGEPLKSVVLTFTNARGDTFRRQGSCVVTQYGMEGSLIYSASALIRDEITLTGSANVVLDLAPGRTVEELTKRLAAPRGSRTISSHLRSRLKLKPVEIGLLREFADITLNNPTMLAESIKAVTIPFIAPRPIAESISTAGGVRFESLDESLMVKSHPGLFCAGEMLDWEAPTGGYLLTACFATGRIAAQGAWDWISRNV